MPRRRKSSTTCWASAATGRRRLPAAGVAAGVAGAGVAADGRGAAKTGATPALPAALGAAASGETAGGASVAVAVGLTALAPVTLGFAALPPVQALSSRASAATAPATAQVIRRSQKVLRLNSPSSMLPGFMARSVASTDPITSGTAPPVRPGDEKTSGAAPDAVWRGLRARATLRAVQRRGCDGRLAGADGTNARAMHGRARALHPGWTGGPAAPAFRECICRRSRRMAVISFLLPASGQGEGLCYA